MSFTKQFTNFEYVVLTKTINQRLYLRSLDKNTLIFSKILLKMDDVLY